MILEKEKLILNTIKEQNIAKVSILQKKLNIPRTSLLRYLAKLEDKGYILKAFGEVRLRSLITESNPLLRIDTDKSSKIKIAKQAAKLINAHETIFIDGGSTNYYLFKELASKNLTIYTNNLAIVSLIDNDFIPKVFFIPGLYNKTTQVSASAASITFLTSMNFDKAFLGFNSLDGGWFATTNENEAHLKKTIVTVNGPQKVYLLGTKNKYGTVANYAFCHISDINLITDTNIKGVIK